MILSGSRLPRIRVSYWCAKGHETRPVFLKLPEDQIPEVWDCRRCGRTASRDPAMATPCEVQEEGFKSHLEYVKERRSSQDAEDVLAGALRAATSQPALSGRTAPGTREAAFSSISHSVRDRPDGPAAGTCTGFAPASARPTAPALSSPATTIQTSAEPC